MSGEIAFFFYFMASLASCVVLLVPTTDELSAGGRMCVCVFVWASVLASPWIYNLIFWNIKAAEAIR